MMQSDIDQFTEFVSALKTMGIVNDSHIAQALDSLDGLEGVISERYFIFGYEELGWYMSKTIPLQKLKEFTSHNHDLLLRHKGPRYFFVQALVDNENFSRVERDELIECMPDKHQPFLKKRFS